MAQGSEDSPKLMDQIIALHLFEYSQTQKEQAKRLVLRMCELKERWFEGDESQVVQTKLTNGARLGELGGLMEVAVTKVKEAVAICDKHSLHDVPSIKARVQMFRIEMKDWEASGGDNTTVKKLIKTAEKDSRKLPKNHPQRKVLLGQTLIEFGMLNAHSSEFDEAVDQFEEGLDLLEDEMDTASPRIFIAKSIYCHSLCMVGSVERADVVAKEIYELRDLDQCKDSVEYGNALVYAALAFYSLGKEQQYDEVMTFSHNLLSSQKADMSFIENVKKMVEEDD